MKRHLHILAIAAIAGSLAASAVQSLFSAWAVQNEIIPPTAGIYTGPQFSQLIGDGLRSVVSCSKGSTAPANVGGSVVDGQCWIDDSASPWIKKRYVNGGWAVEGALDPADSSYSGVIGGGVASIASGTTVDLGSVPQANVTITGTTTVAGFGSAAPTGVVKIIRFDSALLLTHSSNLKVPGGYSLTTAADDRAIVTHLGSGIWEVTQYTRASGVPVDISAVGKVDYTFSAAVPPQHLRGDGSAILKTLYPAYTAKMSRAQSGTRTSGNATITGLSDTSGFGAGMPVESTGVTNTCTIASVTSTTITLNSSACVTSSGTSTVTVLLTGWGFSGGPTTVGLPDCRGRTMAGRDHVGPSALANRLTSSYFGADSSVFNVAGTSQESRNLSIANINAFTPTGTVSTSTSLSLAATAPVQGGYPGTTLANVAAVGTNTTSLLSTPVTFTTATASSTSTFSGSSLGSGTAHAIVPPTLIADCVVRVTP